MQYIVNIAVALAVGGLSSILTNEGQKSFNELFMQSPLTPPSWVFPVVWTVLYILMAVGYTLVRNKGENCGQQLYRVQLLFNFVWPILFFNFNLFLFSFIWLVALLILVILMAKEFYGCVRIAGLLQIPYILWLLFAGYLNFVVFLLN